MKQVTLYTDGACSGNPGPGGWGAILKYKGHTKEMSGAEGMTTNNRMELLGVINGLRMLKEPCEVDIYTDSRYIEQAINAGWLENWKKKGWTRGKNAELANPDLWKELDKMLSYHTVRIHWVKGHADNEYNNRCDELAVNARINIAKGL